MSSAMDCGNELALSALVEMVAAAAVIPAAWPCVELLVINQSGTDDIFWGAMSRTERDITAGFAGQGNPASILLGGADARSSSGMPVGTDYARRKYDEWQEGQR